MSCVGEQKLARIGVEAGQKRGRVLRLLRGLEKTFVELTDQRGLVPVIHMLAQGMMQTDGGGADRLPVTGDVRQNYAGNHAIAAGRDIVKVAAARGGVQRIRVYPALQARRLRHV